FDSERKDLRQIDQRTSLKESGARILKALKNEKSTLAIMRLQVYYAHAMCIYKTKFEKAEKKQIRKHLPSCLIIDPGSFQDNVAKKQEGMKYCFGLIDECNLLVFTRLLGKVTSGVGLEIRHAISKGIPVFELKDRSMKQITKPVKYLSREDTREYYSLWRSTTGQVLRAPLS
ncbi:MAG: hypothetical protein ACRECH_15090, partial [Nitrososphaerales archaeon]